MSKTKLFIDFDGTMFDTAKFRDGIFEVFEKAGYAHEVIMKAYVEECMDYKFSLEHLLNRLERVEERDKDKIRGDIRALYERVPSMLYGDTILFLNNIDREKYEVNLLSMGNFEFQKRKIDHAGIKDLFDNVYICENQKWDYLDTLVKPEEKFILIDDRGDTIKNVAEKYPNSRPMQIERKDEDNADPVRVDLDYDNRVVHSFKQAMSYL
jgi:FMN phosphatase YigB (HAD superfamily)